MRILLLSQNVPPNPLARVYGVYKRLDMFAEALKDLGRIQVLLFAPYDANECQSLMPALERTFSEKWGTEVTLSLCPRNEELSVPALPGSLRLGRSVRKNHNGNLRALQASTLDRLLAWKPDVIFAHRLGMMAPLLQAREPLPPILFDLDDIEHVKLRRVVTGLPRRRQRILEMRYVVHSFAAEYRAVTRATRTFVCSDADRDYLSHRMRSERIVTVPNAVEIPRRQAVTTNRTLLFFGTYAYAPNIQAAEILIHRIWPIVRSRISDARLIIAGPYPERIPSYRTVSEDVEFTGFVEDLDQLYARSRLVTCPLLVGGGTRIKILEAAAYGKPVVSTSIGAEGLDLRDGIEIMIRDHPQSFADACVHFLSEMDACVSMGIEARKRVRALYERSDVVERIKPQVLSALT